MATETKNDLTIRRLGVTEGETFLQYWLDTAYSLISHYHVLTTQVTFS